MAGSETEKSLEQTPTWAIAAVCTVFVVASLLVERGIFGFGRYLKRNKQKELFHTLEVIKNELMLLGFISLFLTVFQPKIANLCMPERVNRIMLPCAYEPPMSAPAPARRRLLTAKTATNAKCSPGRVQVISANGLHQLHIFIFVLAVVHVLYSCITVLLGVWQVHSWKRWEEETRQDEHKSVDDALEKKKHTKASGHFVSKRMNYKFLHCTSRTLHLDGYIYSFFRQFGTPIYKHDYLCLRLGFITIFKQRMLCPWPIEHQLGPTYDFHSYIRRSMEEDFKIVVGISWYLWAFVCIFLLLDIYGWFTYFWIAFIPTVMVLLVGMKLQQVITDLALEVQGGVQEVDSKARSGTVGTVVELEENILKEKVNPIRPRDDLFWFNRPRLLLYVVHFILFQNAFELSVFFWALFTYGFSSCLVGKQWMIIVRLLLGVLVQILCSASTLPLYALVSQLGSNIKMTVFQSNTTVKAIHKWRDKAKKNQKENDDSVRVAPRGKEEPELSIDIELPRLNGRYGREDTHNNADHKNLDQEHPQRTSASSSKQKPQFSGV